jgi:hypothetical protein
VETVGASSDAAIIAAVTAAVASFMVVAPSRHPLQMTRAFGPTEAQVKVIGKASTKTVIARTPSGGAQVQKTLAGRC